MRYGVIHRQVRFLPLHKEDTNKRGDDVKQATKDGTSDKKIVAERGNLPSWKWVSLNIQKDVLQMYRRSCFAIVRKKICKVNK
jgi:hypothetical protein